MLFKKPEHEQIIYSITEAGLPVIFFPKLEIYYIVESFEPCNIHLGKDYHELKGIDITFLLDNFDSNMQNKVTLITKIDSLPKRKIRFSYTQEYIWILS